MDQLNPEDSESADFVRQVFVQRLFDIDQGYYYFWDPLAAAVLMNEDLTTFESSPLTVEIDEGPDSGRIIASDGGPSVRYAVSADRDAFEQELLDTLNDPD